MELPIRILPVGGLGKIGMNCMLIGHEDRYVLVDCGVQFPPSDMIGADKLLPDLSLIERLGDRLEAVLITHGHEDHIGALPWLLPRLDRHTPVFASPFTTELIRNRLSEYGPFHADRMRPLAPGTRFSAGPFEVEPIRVTHSLPDCASLVLRCADATLLHTGDWKIDPEPLDDEHFDLDAFARLQHERVVMLSDSTNILSPGRTTSEAAVVRAIHPLVAAHPGRVIITQFASNLHRLRGLAQVAADTGRQLVLCGASLVRYADSASRARIPVFPPGTAISLEDAKHLAPNQVLVVTTGSQGESRAALARAAVGHHKDLHIGTGDLLLHSARVIPGNEVPVADMFSNLALRGAKIIAGRNAGIHASGHAQRDELAELIRLVRPAVFIPVHGESSFLTAHAALARDQGVDTALVVQNGETIGVGRAINGAPTTTAAAARAPSLDVARLSMETPNLLYNDGPSTGDIDQMRLLERKRIAWNGVVCIDVGVTDLPSGARSAIARTQTRAIFDPDDTLDAILARLAERVVANCPPRTPLRELEEAIAASVRRAVKKSHEKRPDVIVTLHKGAVA